jgi:hypothetical protein
MEGVRKRHSNLNFNESALEDDESQPLINSNYGSVNNTNDRFREPEEKASSIVALSFYDSLLSVVSFFWKSMYESLGWAPPVDDETR